MIIATKLRRSWGKKSKEKGYKVSKLVFPCSQIEFRNRRNAKQHQISEVIVGNDSDEDQTAFIACSCLRIHSWLIRDTCDEYAVCVPFAVCTKTFVANNLSKSKVNFILYACVDINTYVHKSILKGIVNILSSKKMSYFI